MYVCQLGVGLMYATPTSINQHIHGVSTYKATEERLFEVGHHVSAANDHAFDTHQLVNESGVRLD